MSIHPGGQPESHVPQREELRLGRLAPGAAQSCAELEAEIFVGDSPWSAQSFAAELATPTNLYLGLVDARDKVWAYAGLAKLGPDSDPEYEIRNIAVSPRLRRQGLGKLLMDHLMAVVEEQPGPIFLEVRTDNVAAITMYEAYGFRKLGIRRNYYQESGADAYTMECAYPRHE